MAQKKIPARQCIGCMTSRPKKELVRVVRAPSGEISIDLVGKKPGRGAYLCPDPDCLTKAKKKKALERCFEQPFPPRYTTRWLYSWPQPQRRQQQMAKKNNTPAKPKLPPEEALYQALSLCRKAGALTMGFDAVEDACVKSKAWLVMVASDASAKTVQRLDYSVGDLVDVITMPLTQDKLADISRKPVAVYAVTDRNLAKLCFDRLSDCGAIKNEEDMTE